MTGSGARPVPAFETGKRLVVHRERVREAWIDYNGHMNVAYYVLAFDHAADAFFDAVGLTREYRERHAVSTFAMEAHVTYLRELRAGDPTRFEIQLLDIDEKRFHYINMMYREADGGAAAGAGAGDVLAATGEWISTHMDMRARKTAPFRPEIYGRLVALRDAHGNMPVPEQVGRVIGIRRRGGGRG